LATIVTQLDDQFAPGGGDGEGYYSDQSAIGEATQQFITLFVRNIVLIGTIVVAFLALAVVITMLQTPRFTATTSVQISNQAQQVLGDDLGDKDNTSDESAYDTERFLNTQVEIVKSRSLAERVARRLNLAADPRFMAAMNQPPFEPGKSINERRDTAVGLLQDSISVLLPRETRIAQISVTTIDPTYSAKIANAFAEEFIQANLQRKYDSSAYARQFVAQQMDESRVRLENSERELNAYARSAGLIRSRGASAGSATGSDVGTQSVTQSSLAQLNEAANKAQADLTAAKSRWEAESAVPLMNSQAVLSNPAVQTLLTQRAQVESQLQSQKTKYLADHPSVQGLQAQIDAINAQIKAIANGIRAGIRNDYNAARAAESQLRAQVSQLQGATMSEQDRSVRYNTLAREADTNRQLYEGLLQRYRELNAAAGISASNISIIDNADVPSFPSSPSLIRNLAVGLLLGFMSAFGLVFIREKLDDRIRVPEDVEAKIHLPLLGVIPKESEDNLADQLRDPKSPLSEAYSSLRGSLMYSTTQGLPHVLLVTSSSQSEGKSTTSYATARALSRVGKRVLLVDADMRRPSVHHRVGLPNTAGLSTLLTSQQDVMSVVNTTEEESLFVITAGPHPPSPSELLASPRMIEVVEKLSEHFDAVVLDSPPVLGLADAPVLSAIADGVAFVVEAESGQRGAVKAALRRLRAMKPRLVGAILTKFDPSKSANRYSSYYGYEYYRYRADD
jgi:capsular exopolysaccharide synthesis family protein